MKKDAGLLDAFGKGASADIQLAKQELYAQVGGWGGGGGRVGGAVGGHIWVEAGGRGLCWGLCGACVPDLSAAVRCPLPCCR